MQRQRYTIIGTKDGYNIKDFIMAYSETEAKLIYKRSRPDVEVTECYITKANDWHGGETSIEIHSQHLRRKINPIIEVDKKAVELSKMPREEYPQFSTKDNPLKLKLEDENAEVATYRMYSDGRVERIDNKTPDTKEIAGAFLPEQIGVGGIWRLIDKKDEK